VVISKRQDASPPSRSPSSGERRPSPDEELLRQANVAPLPIGSCREQRPIAKKCPCSFPGDIERLEGLISPGVPGW